MIAQRRLSSLHPLSWPLWVKFLVGFMAGLVILTIPALTFVREGIIAIGTENAKAFVSETGVKHATAVNSTLVDAGTTLNAFTTNIRNNQRLTGFLLRDVQARAQLYLPEVTEGEIADLFRTSLINPASSSFESVNLLDRNGQELLMTDVSSSSFEPSDLSQSAAYRTAISTQLQGQSSAIAVSLGDQGAVVEIVNTIYWRDGTPIGYIVARVSNSRVFFNNIRLDDTRQNYSAYTFLTSSQGVLIAPPQTRDRATVADQSIGVSRALAGQSGVDIYSANDGADYVGYYTLIGGTPFALVTQAPFDVVYSNALNFFTVRAFVVSAGVIALLVLLVLIFTQLITPSLYRLRQATQAISDGNFEVEVPDAERGDEIGMLAASVVTMRDQVRLLIGDLEGRIATRTRDISATQDISRFAVTQRDLQTLMDRVVELIVERFPNIYHAQIFMLDEEAETPSCVPARATAGQELLSRGHRLSVGSLSVIGQVTQQGRLIVARDAAMSQVHRSNEFLPETRAEVAIPLSVGDVIIGALDVQSKTRDAFDDDQVNVLQTMADQIAVALQNARLYEELLRRFSEIEESNREATRRAWQEFMRDQRVEGLTSEAGYKTKLDVSSLRREAIQRGETVVGQVTDRNTIPIAVPVQLRGQVLGAVEWEIPAGGLSEEKLELAQELANRLALSLDNARLFQESQRATERERLVNNIATKLTAQTSINDILQTAVREVGQALRAPQVSIRLHGSGEGNGNGVSSGEE